MSLRAAQAPSQFPAPFRLYRWAAGASSHRVPTRTMYKSRLVVYTLLVGGFNPSEKYESVGTIYYYCQYMEK